MYRSLLPTPPLTVHPVPLRNSTEDTGSTSMSPPSTLRSNSPIPPLPPLQTPVKKMKKTIIDHTTRFSKFLADSNTAHASFVHDHNIKPAEDTAIRLRETQRRFAQGVPIGGDATCAGIDRQLVLGIYTEALSKLAELPGKHTQIAAECARKTRVILGIISADPDDMVFISAGQLLRPLEPQYANPRLDADVDEFGNLAQWRLNAWRKDGWPYQYPAAAVKEEKQVGKRLVDHKGNRSMKNGKMLKLAFNDMEMWDGKLPGNVRAEFEDKTKGEVITQVKGKDRKASTASRRSRRREYPGDTVLDLD